MATKPICCKQWGVNFETRLKALFGMRHASTRAQSHAPGCKRTHQDAYASTMMQSRALWTQHQPNVNGTSKRARRRASGAHRACYQGGVRAPKVSRGRSFGALQGGAHLKRLKEASFGAPQGGAHMERLEEALISAGAPILFLGGRGSGCLSGINNEQLRQTSRRSEGAPQVC